MADNSLPYFGVNGALKRAEEALRYLAVNDRPIGGEQYFNRAHCEQIADDLAETTAHVGPAMEMFHIAQTAKQPADPEMDRLMKMDVIEVGVDGELREARDEELGALMFEAAAKGKTDPQRAQPPVFDGLEGATSHPDYEHWTCGTNHIRAQRLLRIVERAAPFGLTTELIESLDSTIYDAGPADCRRALENCMDEVPW
ncbi:hypothetical protein [Sphingobium yanoikuyae]|uniref:hypothetical protein n=1 Tax=Sphingobium yanoikuyae TaxID=13690 RepID=UPI0035AED698